MLPRHTRPFVCLFLVMALLFTVPLTGLAGDLEDPRQEPTAVGDGGAVATEHVEASKAAIEKSKPFKEPIVVPVTMATAFYPAEDYHQDYYQKNPIRYTYYRTGCRRDARLKELWGDKAGK